MGTAMPSSVARRVRALAHLVPVLLLERDRNAGSSGRDWSCYDPKLLAVCCVDALAVSSGLSGTEGVPRDELVGQLATVAGLSAPDRPSDEHREVAEWLLDRLLAAGTGSRSHRVAWTDPDDSYATRTERVRLMYEQIGHDETVEVVLDDSAVHLLMIGLDVDVEDAQVAVDAVLRHQLESGRLEDARASAEQALRLTREYRSRIARLLLAARRDLSSLDWGEEVEPLLLRARTHVRDRLTFERALYRHANEARSGLDGDPAQAAVSDQIVVLLDECMTMLTALNSELSTAIDVYLEEQPRQLFNSSVPIDAVDLPARVLDPVLAAPAGTDLLDVAVHLLGPVAGRLLSLHVADELVRPPVEPSAPPPPPEGDLVAVDAVIEALDQRHFGLLDRLLDEHAGSSVRLSQLLADVPDDDPVFAHQMTLLCGLAALQGFSPDDAAAGQDDTRLVAHDDGVALDHDVLSMPDLLLEVRT